MKLKKIYLLLSITCFHLVWGQECQNSTITDCNFKQELITVNNCSKCICRKGFYQHHGLGGCQRCGDCEYPFVIIQNCTTMTDTECGLCQKTYFHTKTGCRKCQQCEHGVLIRCGSSHDTICAPKVTMPPTTHSAKSTINLKFTNRNQADNGQDWRQNHIWHILFFLESTIIIVIIVIVCVVCRNNSRRLYALADTSSLDTSLSSLMLNTKSKWPDITSLTEQERGTLIRELPGGYAESLGQFLNPIGPNNWVHLAYDFKFTLTQIANLKNTPDCTQELLFELGSKNTTTVERLWRGLKNIKRDDACSKLVNFVQCNRVH